ncbi:type VI secretion protein, partial [Lysobacter pythonis]
MVFFRIIFLYLDKQIEVMRDNMLGGFIQWILLILTTFMTIWIIFQGWLIVTGRSREPMMALVTNALRIGFLSFLAVGFTFMGTDIGKLLTETMPK